MSVWQNITFEVCVVFVSCGSRITDNGLCPNAGTRTNEARPISCARVDRRQATAATEQKALVSIRDLEHNTRATARPLSLLGAVTREDGQQHGSH